jgi:ankyrin repeat protein
MRSILALGVASLLATPAVGADMPPLTQDSGAPVGDNQRSKAAGPDGGVLLEDFHLIEKLARFDRERIPERVAHGADPKVKDAAGNTALGLSAQQGNAEMVALLAENRR